MAFVSLAIIALVAFASPFIASAIPGKPVPETVFLLVFGAVLGPHMLGVIHVDAEVSLVSELGLAFLFLLAGFEIDPKNITGVEGRYGMATWVVTFCIAWLAVRFTPWFSVSHFDGIAVTLALTSTALGALMPILRERLLAGTRVGAGELELHGNPYISGRHCKFSYQNGQYYLTDIGSSNGTYLNGQMLPRDVPQALKDGDTITIATSVFRVTRQEGGGMR